MLRHKSKHGTVNEWSRLWVVSRRWNGKNGEWLDRGGLFDGGHAVGQRDARVGVVGRHVDGWDVAAGRRVVFVVAGQRDVERRPVVGRSGAVGDHRRSNGAVGPARRRAGAHGQSVRDLHVAAQPLALQQDPADGVPRRVPRRRRRRHARHRARRQRRELERRAAQRHGRHQEPRRQIQRSALHRPLRPRYVTDGSTFYNWWRNAMPWPPASLIL